MIVILAKILNFSLPLRSEQVSEAHANETKHDHSPEIIVVLDPSPPYPQRVVKGDLLGRCVGITL